MSGAGLQRRRVATHNIDTASDNTSPLRSPTLSSPSASIRPSTPRLDSQGQGSSSGGRSYTATQGGHKIGYDPRDLQEQDEERLVPKLTIMEEVLLLGLKDKQGYLSFWNDNISYTLRGCLLIELALRQRIAMVKDSNRRRFPLADRYIEVVDDKLTGEVLLDEALKMMKVSEKMSVGTWIDLLSGETWNVMKIGYQLKQVRERLAKGLVDKGVLRTEKKNFLLFDMATHPVSDPTYKDDVLKRTLSLLTARTAAVPVSNFYSDQVKYRTIRAVTMVCAAFAANVLENALVHLGYDAREAAFAKCDELLAEFSTYPFGSRATASLNANGTISTGPASIPNSSRRVNLGAGSSGSDAATASNLAEIGRLARSEAQAGGPDAELYMEIVAGVLQVFSRMDSLL